MRRILPPAAAITALIVSGVLHGVWTHRWVTAADPAVSAAKLDHVPMVLGDWQARKEELQDRREVGPVSGYLFRTYVNRRDGSGVTVFLVCGGPGPISIHTPDACYKANGYTVEDVSPYSLSSPALAAPAEFLTAQMVKKKATEEKFLRIFWSWSAAGSWSAPDSPRLTFGNCPVLYKLYVIQEMTGSSEVRENDPCVKFMQQFLPELQQTLFTESNVVQGKHEG